MRTQISESLPAEYEAISVTAEVPSVQTSVALENTPPHQRRPPSGYIRIKRVLDVVTVMLSWPAVLPVVVLAGLAILLTMGRPIFFTQERVGRNGRVFKMLKLRTMKQAPALVRHATLRDDPRITPVGLLLRRTHIDELPQLWNLLRGDMTLIGPRPEQPHLVAYYRQHIPDYDQRHTVPPGLTGLSQVFYGYAADLEETRQKLLYDIEYVENIGLRIDLRIFLRTIQVYTNPHLVR